MDTLWGAGVNLGYSWNIFPGCTKVVWYVVPTLDKEVNITKNSQLLMLLFSPEGSKTLLFISHLRYSVIIGVQLVFSIDGFQTLLRKVYKCSIIKRFCPTAKKWGFRNLLERCSYLYSFGIKMLITSTLKISLNQFSQY